LMAAVSKTYPRVNQVSKKYAKLLSFARVSKNKPKQNKNGSAVAMRLTCLLFVILIFVIA